MEDGTIAGKGLSSNTSSNTSSKFTLTGTVTDKGVLVNATTDVGSDFEGSLTEKNGSGTWSNATGGFSGTWMATKN
ncbi:MAG: hypothetical protein ACI8ZN_000962 [Bacteroidia bacterium]|jgi:hypothetical protein